jgi:hypothetical protein
MIGGGPKRPWCFSLRLHRLESQCHPLTEIRYETAVGGDIVINRIINNRASGNAPLIFQVTSGKFLLEQQFTPVKQMDLW